MNRLTWQFLICVFVVSGLFGQANRVMAGDPSGNLVKENIPLVDADAMEVTPFLWQDRLMLLCCKRPFISSHQPETLALAIMDMETKKFGPDFAASHSLGCGFVHEGVFHAYAARQDSVESWFVDIDHFYSNDLIHWERMPAIDHEDGEHLLNSSVCRDPQGFIMAYESDRPVGFCFKFARSTDLNQWTKIPGIAFAGPDRKTYSACPVIRYFDPWYYVIYLSAEGPGYVSNLVRSQDLIHWEVSPMNPVLSATPEEGINNSDVDVIELEGKTWLYYATGNQTSQTDVRRAVYNGCMKDFFESRFPKDQLAETIEAICP